MQRPRRHAIPGCDCCRRSKAKQGHIFLKIHLGPAIGRHWPSAAGGAARSNAERGFREALLAPNYGNRVVTARPRPAPPLPGQAARSYSAVRDKPPTPDNEAGGRCWRPCPRWRGGGGGRGGAGWHARRGPQPAPAPAARQQKQTRGRNNGLRAAAAATARDAPRGAPRRRLPKQVPRDAPRKWERPPTNRANTHPP